MILSILLAAIVAALIAPLPYRVEAPAVVMLDDAAPVFVTVGGRLVRAARVGDCVEKGGVLAELENLDLDREIVRLEGEERRQRLHLEHLERLRGDDPSAGEEIPAARAALEDVEEQLHLRRRDLEELTLRAPRDGVVLAPPETSQRANLEKIGRLPSFTGTPLEEKNLGCFLPTGTPFCFVGSPKRFQADLLVEQSEMELLERGQPARLRLDQFPERIFDGEIRELATIDAAVAPREWTESGEIAADRDASGAAPPRDVLYLARVSLDAVDSPLIAGARGRAKISVARQSLARRLIRELGRTFGQ